MTSGPLWLLIAGVTFGTFVLRLSFLHLFAQLEEVPPVERVLRFVPAAVLAALVVPALVYVDGDLTLAVSNERLWAGLLAGGAAWITRSVVVTLVVGMLALWTLQSMLPT